MCILCSLGFPWFLVRCSLGCAKMFHRSSFTVPDVSLWSSLHVLWFSCGFIGVLCFIPYVPLGFSLTECSLYFLNMFLACALLFEAEHEGKIGNLSAKRSLVRSSDTCHEKSKCTPRTWCFINISSKMLVSMISTPRPTRCNGGLPRFVACYTSHGGPPTYYVLHKSGRARLCLNGCCPQTSLPSRLAEPAQN